MAGSPMRSLINHGSRSKHKFLLKALPLPLPWRAHLCSLTNTLPPLSHNLCSYYHPVAGSFDGYSSFLFSFGSGLGVRDPWPRINIGIVICPLFPFWRAGRPVWKHSTGGSSMPFLLYCSCFGTRPVLGASAPQAAQLSFPLCLISALPALCVSALHGRGDA